jgi:diacylglycerol kinase family enzyme
MPPVVFTEGPAPCHDAGVAVLGVVVNPRSRRNRGNSGAVEAVRGDVGDLGLVRESGSAESLRAAARDFREAGVDLVLVHGGDGTNGLVLAAVLEAWGDRPLPRFGLLRGGTMNTVANGLGVPRGRPGALLGGVVSAVREGRPLRTRKTGTLDAGGRLGFLFGAGVIHGFLAEYYDRGDPHPTPLTAVETLGVAIGSALVQGKTIRRMSERLRAAITLDGERFERQGWLFVGAGTAPQLGLGFKPFQRSVEDPTRFHALGAWAPPPRFVGSLPGLWRGHGMREGHGIERVAREMVLETDTDVVRFMVDGDLVEAPAPLRVVLGPVLDVVIRPEPSGRG